MGISDYRDKDFRVSFARVTLVRGARESIVREFNLAAWHRAFLHSAGVSRAANLSPRRTTERGEAQVRTRCNKKQQPGVEAGLSGSNGQFASRAPIEERALSIGLCAELRDLMHQAGNLAACRVPVNDIALSGAHQLGLRAHHRLHRCIAVAALDRVFDAAHGATHLGAAGLVDRGTTGNLARRFLGGSGVGHRLKYP